MSHKLGQIIAVRENTWMIRIRWLAIRKPNNAAITTALFMARCGRRRSF